MNQTKKKKILMAMALIGLMVGYGFTKMAVDKRVEQRSKIDVRYLPSPRFADTLAVGFNAALADYYWVEAINYFGDQIVRKSRNYKYMSSYFDLIENLDPLFSIFYDWAATVHIYNGLKITRTSVVESTRVANRGIINFDKQYRYDPQTILKAAFNFAIETEQRELSIPYFTLAARTFPDKRDMLLVASTYAGLSNNQKLATDLKIEFFGYLAFEATSKNALVEAIQVLSSSKMNLQAIEFLALLRSKMEKDETLKKMVADRVKSQSEAVTKTSSSTLSMSNKLSHLLDIDFSRTWLPPDLHVLFTL